MWLFVFRVESTLSEGADTLMLRQYGVATSSAA